MGIIKLFAGTYAPRDWAFCDGRLLSVAEYTALYSLLGTQFGGDGRTTFGLPDLRSRVPIGAGQGLGLSPYPQGIKGGQEIVTLAEGQIPSHYHYVHCDVKTPGRSLVNSPDDNVPAMLSQGEGYGTDLSGNTYMHQNMLTPFGGNQPHENRPPFQAINYIICTVGIFPPRD